MKGTFNMSKLSKTSSSSTPTFTNGAISLNDIVKATTKNSGSTVTSNYNMSENEKALYDYAQSTLAEILPSVNTFSDETISSIQNQLAAYTKQGQKTLDSIYSPIINNLKNDIASRFGNFDNSMFMDNLETIEGNRALAMSDLAESVLSKQDELVDNELSSRYNYINLLNTLQNQTLNNALNYINASQKNSNTSYTTTPTNTISYGNLSTLISLLNYL